MKIKDKIMRLFGYENIENIHIREEFKKHPPKSDKMWERRLYWMWNNRKFKVPIVVTRIGAWVLMDGYTSYLIAKENNIKYVKVVRVGCLQENN